MSADEFVRCNAQKWHAAVVERVVHGPDGGYLLESGGPVKDSDSLTQQAQEF